jgi:hypothetical protein
MSADYDVKRVLPASYDESQVTPLGRECLSR